MSGNVILTEIRSASMPIHKKLDEIGITHYIKSGTFDRSIYEKWLQVTYQFLVGYRNLLQDSKVVDSSVLGFSPEYLGIEEILNDLETLNASSSRVSALAFPTLSQPILTVVPVYTLLGSLMGSKMIFRVVQELPGNLPSSYLEKVLQYMGSWKSFLAYTDQLNGSKPTVAFPNTVILRGVIFKTHS